MQAPALAPVVFLLLGLLLSRRRCGTCQRAARSRTWSQRSSLRTFPCCEPMRRGGEARGSALEEAAAVEEVVVPVVLRAVPRVRRRLQL